LGSLFANDKTLFEMSSRLKFSITHEILRGKARVGKLSVFDKNDTLLYEIPTPAPIIPTERGFVPYLAPDLVAHLPKYMLNYSWDHIFKDFAAGGVPECYGYQRMMNIVSYNNPRNHESPSLVNHLSGDNHIGIPTDQGLKRMAIEEFAKAASCTNFTWICPPSDSPLPEQQGAKRLTKSFNRSLHYLDTLIKFKGSEQHVAAVLEGGLTEDTRASFAKEAATRDVFGFVFNGLCKGESVQARKRLLSAMTDNIPADHPRYMPNTKNLWNALEAVKQGVDFVDAVYPIELAEAGYAFLSNGRKLHMWDSKNDADFTPIEANCTCFGCQNHTKAYIYHLLNTHELLGPILLVQHNLFSYLKLFERLRQSILDDSLDEFELSVFR
jgi:queuine tRNA-ribosyltransferase accessory subunit